MKMKKLTFVIKACSDVYPNKKYWADQYDSYRESQKTGKTGAWLHDYTLVTISSLDREEEEVSYAR
jgi:hypothetical protein